MEQIATNLRISPSTVFSVATFYHQFKLTPPGRNSIKVCRGTACHVGGADVIQAELERKLQVQPGGTTSDLEYSLDTVACIGACALAPVVIINDEIFGRTSIRKILEVLSERENG
jgi:NADH:ubiquinone oxidoreductase subunit E